MPIGNGVYLDLLLKRILQFNVNHIFLSLHYKPELFLDYTNSTNLKDFVTTIIEPEPLGTGGAIKYVLHNSSISSPFFVINGDSLSDINLDHMQSAFEVSEQKAMIGVSFVKNKNRYGTVSFDDEKVTSFEEKGVSARGWINNGHYIMNEDIFKRFDGEFSLEKTLYPELVKNRQLGVFKVYNDDFIDMGIPQNYEKLCEKYKDLN